MFVSDIYLTQKCLSKVAQITANSRGGIQIHCHRGIQRTLGICLILSISPLCFHLCWPNSQSVLSMLRLKWLPAASVSNHPHLPPSSSQLAILEKRKASTAALIKLQESHEVSVGSHAHSWANHCSGEGGVPWLARSGSHGHHGIKGWRVVGSFQVLGRVPHKKGRIWRRKKKKYPHNTIQVFWKLSKRRDPFYLSSFSLERAA